ncbi:MAG: hypothetical protein AAB436_02670 [Patescibacteria group bacterium]
MRSPAQAPNHIPTVSERFDRLWSVLRPTAEDAPVTQSSRTAEPQTFKTVDGEVEGVIRTEVEGYTTGSLRPRVRSIQVAAGEETIKMNDVIVAFGKNDPEVGAKIGVLETLMSSAGVSSQEQHVLREG